jgi:hypothetical protein
MGGASEVCTVFVVINLRYLLTILIKLEMRRGYEQSWCRFRTNRWRRQSA